MGVFEQFPYTNFHDLNTDWIIRLVKALDAKVDSMEEWKAQHEVEYQELKQFMDDLKAGIFTPAMYDAMIAWIQANIFDIIGDMVKFITVYLNDTGHICIRMPSQWDIIKFNTTGLDINVPLEPEYGHLTISY